MCGAKVCKLNSDICQIRLDFEKFVISGPSTVTRSMMSTLFGVPSGSNADTTTTPNVADTSRDVSYATNCLTDTFTISNAEHVPVLCGDLADDHRKDLFHKNVI